MTNKKIKVEELKRLVDEVASKLPDDANVAEHLFFELNRKVRQLPDDDTHTQPLAGRFQRWKRLWGECWPYWANRFKSLDKQHLPDPEAQRKISDLLADGWITELDYRRIMERRILARGEDGVLEAILPDRWTYRVGQIGIATLVILGSYCTAKIIGDPFYFQHAFPYSIILGIALGLLGGELYFSAWGKRSLAIKLRLLMPWVRLRAPVADPAERRRMGIPRRI